MKLQGGNRVCLNMIEGNEQRTVAESFSNLTNFKNTAMKTKRMQVALHVKLLHTAYFSLWNPTVIFIF